MNGEYIWKYTQRAFDFSVLGNTPITFPIEWDKSKIPGYVVNASLPNFHGLTAYIDFSSVAARFFEPQVRGIGATPASMGGNGVFRIDHDEVFNQTTHVQYQPWKNGPWIGFNWRYDSGLVAGPVPCAGGNCANGPDGTDSIVDFSALTPDQQFEAGLHCGSVYATPTTPISPTGLCTASEYGSSLVNIPAAGTENDDHNPPRIAPRNLFDIAVGDDNLFHTEKYRWSVRLTVINLMNKEALYNFLSTFSRTHYVTPRAITAQIGFHFRRFSFTMVRAPGETVYRSSGVPAYPFSLGSGGGPSWAKSAGAVPSRALQWVPLGDRVFRVLPRIFCSSSDVSARRDRCRIQPWRRAWRPPWPKATPSRQNGRPCQPGLMSNGMIRKALAGQQNHIRLASHPLRPGTSPSRGLQLPPLSFIDPKSFGTREHAPIRSLCRPL